MTRFLIFSLFLSILACTGTKQIVEIPAIDFEETILDTMVVVAPKIKRNTGEFKIEPYNKSAKRTFDLIHTKLDLSFDWEKQHVLGVAQLELSPLFYPSNTIVLDAKGFDIHKISNDITKFPLKYDYDGFQLEITLDKVYIASEQVKIAIDYTAKPNEGPEGGSAAITSDKGLFFINPLGDEEDKPMQIWTQGETESNSRWFPTFDKPNERCTQEIRLTVDSKFKSLSNGLLKSSVDNNNGTRTDSWVMDKPHAPYLFMVAIGDFAKVDDQWEDIPISYYVEPQYEQDAKAIFNHTPEMLQFFSDYTGVKYPWDKYAQVIAKDFVSGAMENTTAVVFGDFIQKHKRELIDNNNDYIVAHEMFHHWFGDYVTCESWSNLTLNEGFANYSEYLWTEYKYGKLHADNQRASELRGYLNSAQNTGTHDLIDYGYDDREKMFDAHSYNKGGLVLHMLRNYVGDEAFRAALKYYLTKHAYSAVEAHELRMAFEDVTGEDLNWFFNQWYFDKGHPELELDHSYADGVYTIKVDQVQYPESNAAIFQIPVDIDIYLANGTKERKRVWLNERSQYLNFELSEQPRFVNFDAENMILGTKKEKLSTTERIFEYNNSEMYQDRTDALAALKGEVSAKTTFEKALNDPFYTIRRTAINYINPNNDKLISILKELALKDPKSQVRTAAINKLANNNDPSLVSFVEKVLKKEQAYGTYSAALSFLYDIDPSKGLIVAESMMDEDNYELIAQLSDIFASTSDPKYLKFFESKITSSAGFNSYPIFSSYTGFLTGLSPEAILSNLNFLIDTAKNNNSNFKRFMATTTLNNIKGSAITNLESETDSVSQEITKELINNIQSAIMQIKSVEKNPQLIQRYQGF